jgi:integrase
MPIITSADCAAKVAKRATVTDSARGLVLRQTPTGRHSWHYRPRNAETTKKIGTYPQMSLREAYRQADIMRDRELEGENVIESQRQLEAAAAERARIGGVSVEQAIGEYVIHLKAKGNRSWADTESILRRNAAPMLGRMRLCDVTPRDLAVLERRIMGGDFSSRYNGKPLLSSVRHTRKWLSAMFTWAIEPEQGYVESNPCDKLKALQVEPGRDRVMSNEEITAFWQLLDVANIDRRTALLFKLALATGRRSSEIRLLRVDELVLDAEIPHMAIPAGRIKNKKPLVMALSTLAVEIIKEAIADQGQTFVFEGDKGEPLNRQILNRAMRGRPDKGTAGLIEQMGIAYQDAFKPHDFRHTIGTVLVEELGDEFNDADVALALGHSFKGERVQQVRKAPQVTQNYINGHRLKRKRKIMEAWADYLRPLIGANVVRLRA